MGTPRDKISTCAFTSGLAVLSPSSLALMLIQSKVISLDRNLSCAGQFHHFLIFWTFVLAYSKAELKRNSDKRSSCYTPCEQGYETPAYWLVHNYGCNARFAVCMAVTVNIDLLACDALWFGVVFTAVSEEREDGSNDFLRNVCKFLPGCAESQPMKW